MAADASPRHPIKFHVWFGSNSEVRARSREVCFALRNGHPPLGCPVRKVLILLQKSKIELPPKNLAKVDLWTSLLLRRSSTQLQRPVIDFGCNDVVPRVAGTKAHQRR